MSVIETLETAGQTALTAVEHAAAWLVGAISSSEKSLKQIEHDDPIVAEAITATVAAAEARGIPVGEIQIVGQDVIAAAKDLAAGLTSTASATPKEPPAPLEPNPSAEQKTEAKEGSGSGSEHTS